MLTEHINRDIARGTKNLQISCLIWASLLLEAPAHLPPEISHKPIKADIIIHKNPQHQRFHISQGTKVYSHLWPKKHYLFLGIAFEALALICRPPMWFLRKTHFCINCSLCASIPDNCQSRQSRRECKNFQVRGIFLKTQKGPCVIL